MRKLLILSLVLCLLVAALSASAFAVTDTTANYSLDTTGNYTNLSSKYGISYFPFIYSEESTFAWYVDNLIGPNNCAPGALYIKDMSSGEIVLVHSTPDEDIVSFGTGIFFTVDNSKIYRVNYSEPQVLETIYSTIVAPLGNLWYDNENSKLYFTQNSNIIEHDVSTGNERNIGYFEGIISFFTLDPTTIVWKDSISTYIRSDVANTSTPVDEPYEGKLELLVGEQIEEHDLTATAANTQVLSSIGTNNTPSFPLPGYGNGTYFTDNGGPCTDHGEQTCEERYYSCNCKVYYGMQCMGFAKYVSDQYNHRSDWTEPSGDYVYGTSITTCEAAQAFFKSLEPGSYIRLDDGRDPYGGVHSITLVSASSSGLTVYECNLDGQCGISLTTYSYSWYVNYMYNTVVYALSHNYDGNALKYNSTYHKVPCSSSGCDGYVLKSHYAQSPGSNATCLGCGYVGYINSGIMGLEPPISQINALNLIQDEER